MLSDPGQAGDEAGGALGSYPWVPSGVERGDIDAVYKFLMDMFEDLGHYSAYGIAIRLICLVRGLDCESPN